MLVFLGFTFFCAETCMCMNVVTQVVRMGGAGVCSFGVSFEFDVLTITFVVLCATLQSSGMKLDTGCGSTVAQDICDNVAIKMNWDLLWTHTFVAASRASHNDTLTDELVRV